MIRAGAGPPGERLMYGALLFFHSWIRWGVVVLAVYCFGRALVRGARGLAWEAADDQGLWAYGWVVTSQAFIGMTLYFFSPLPRAAFAMGQPFLKMAMLRFYALEHPILMLTAWILSVIGLFALYRLAPERRHRGAMVLFLVVLVLIAWAIPWPGPEMGRPLFRFERL